jgi:hypothetical protein
MMRNAHNILVEKSEWKRPLKRPRSKVKVKSMCFNWAPRHEDVSGEWRCSSTHSLNSALDGGEWSDSRPGRFTPRERAPGTHWTGGWVGPRAVPDAMVKRKIPSPHRESNPRTLIVQPIAQLCTDWAVTALRPRSRWTNNIRMDLREIGWEDVDWSHLAYDRNNWHALRTW